MKRRLMFKDSVIDAFDKNWICELIPELEDKFARRKEFSEFFFEPCVIDLTLERLERLSNQFFISIDFANIVINEI